MPAPNQKLRVLLTGASGSIGRAVLARLLDQKDRFDITVFDRPSRDVRNLFARHQASIKTVFGDFTKPADLRPACANQDFVIHLAELIPPGADDAPELAHQINTLGTAALVQELEDQSPTAFLLFSSSISVYGDRLQNPHIMVDDPPMPSPRDAYAGTKIAAEKIIRDSNLDWSIFRLTSIMGGHKMSKLMFHMPLETKL